jgi:hypothetical protein
MKTEIIYRFSIKTDNVYSFLMCDYVTTIANYKNEVSGWIKKSNLWKLNNALLSRGYSFRDKNIKLVTSNEYWRNYYKYNDLPIKL